MIRVFTPARKSILAAVTIVAGSLVSSSAQAAPPLNTQMSSFSTSKASLQENIDNQIALYGGIQRGTNEVVYDGGDVIVTFPNPKETTVPTSLGSRPASEELTASPMAARNGRSAAAADGPPTYLRGCPYSDNIQWHCFYADANFIGRMLQFKDSGNQSLATYGFANMTSSWVNASYKAKITVYNSSKNVLWYEAPRQAVGNVGTANDNKATQFNRF